MPRSNEVRLLIDAINPKRPGFGERPENQWTASESGTGKIIILIKHHRGSGLPQTEQIKDLLNERPGLTARSPSPSPLTQAGSPTGFLLVIASACPLWSRRTGAIARDVGAKHHCHGVPRTHCNIS